MNEYDPPSLIFLRHLTCDDSFALKLNLPFRKNAPMAILVCKYGFTRVVNLYDSDTIWFMSSNTRTLKQRRQSSSNPKSQSEQFNRHKGAASGFPSNPYRPSQPSEEKGRDHLENLSERFSHSGPLAPGFGWAKSGKKYDHDISVGSNRPDLSKLSSLVASRSVVAADVRDRFAVSHLESSHQIERPVRLLDEHPRKQDQKRHMQNPAGSRQFDNGRASVKESNLHGHGHKANQIHFSGPLLVQPNKVDQMLKEHDRRIQEAARRARLEKARAGKGQAQGMQRTNNSIYVTSVGSR